MAFKRLRSLITLLLAIAAPAAHGAERALEIAGLKVTMWSADGIDSPARRPVILFSHGFHGCATQSRFLMEAFAKAGYLVFAPNHADATCAGGAAARPNASEQPFRRPEWWTEDTYRDRAMDLRNLLAAIGGDARFNADTTRVGLAGAWPRWTLDNVRAVLALSPYTHPFAANNTLRNIAVPVMYQGGTRDVGLTPELKRGFGTYDSSPAPKYYVELDGAGHMAWTNFRSTYHDSIAAYGVAFMDRYVRDLADAGRALERKRADVTVLKHEGR